MESEQKINDYDNPLKSLESIMDDDFLAKYNWKEIDISADYLDFAEPYVPPRYTLKRHGVPFANKGDLHIISGKPGNGKTGLMSILCAAILSSKYYNTEYALDERPVILYIDTEQGKDDTIAFKNRVCTMANIDMTKPNEQFVIIRLRDTESAMDRWRKVLKAISEVKPTDIFLDGVLDVVKDYNSAEECQPIVRDCMNVSDKYKSSFWLVLHENPMVDKLVGVLGSIFQRKVAEIFTIRKIKQCDLKPAERDPSLPPIYFMVKQVKARGRDVDDWMYYFMADAAGWGIPVEIIQSDQPEEPEPDPNSTDKRPSEEEVRKAVSVIGGETISMTLLRQRIMTELKPCGSARAKYFIELAVSLGYLLKDGNKYSASDKLFKNLLTEDDNEEEEVPF